MDPTPTRLNAEPSVGFEEALTALGLDPETIREAGAALAAKRRKDAEK